MKSPAEPNVEQYDPEADEVKNRGLAANFPTTELSIFLLRYSEKMTESFLFLFSHSNDRPLRGDRQRVDCGGGFIPGCLDSIKLVKLTRPDYGFPSRTTRPNSSA